MVNSLLDTLHQCEEVTQLSLEVKDLFIEYRFTFIVACMMALNIVSHYVKNEFIQHFKAYQHLSLSARKELGGRCMQLIFGIFISLTGYSFNLYTLLTGCNANEIFLFFLGGIWLISFDFHELIQRWPLPPALLGHHLAVVGLGLALVDWKVIPSNPDDQIHWALVLLISNIGTTWVTDFFHAIYRTHFSLSFILNFQKFYLVLSLVRLANFGLFIAMTAHAKQSGQCAGAAIMALLTAAYAYNTSKAIRFVYTFDCVQYFSEHQAQWKKLDK